MLLRPTILVLFGGMLIAAALLSCARSRNAEPETNPTGMSEVEIVPPPEPKPPPEGYTLQPGRMVIPPIPKRLTPPRYPDAALTDEVACVAELLYHIETDGTTRLVRLEWREPPPEQHLSDFESTIRFAMADWEYQPALRLIPKKQPDGSTVTEQQAVPKARHAIVRFRVVNGEGVVD